MGSNNIFKMSGASAKKAARASSKALKMFALAMILSNVMYGFARFYFGVKLSLFGIFRWIFIFIFQLAAALFLSYSETQNVGSDKHKPDSSAQEYIFDAFAVLTAAQIFATFEFTLRRSEWSWLLASVVPAALLYIVVIELKKGGAFSMLFGGSKVPPVDFPSLEGYDNDDAEEDDTDPSLAAKRKRRQELKMKRYNNAMLQANARPGMRKLPGGVTKMTK